MTVTVAENLRGIIGVFDLAFVVANIIFVLANAIEGKFSLAFFGLLFFLVLAANTIAVLF